MIILKTFELFSSSYNNIIDIIIKNDDEFKCKFIINNDLYFFHARYENKIKPEFIRYGWHITFGIDNDNKYLLTNKNIPFKILNMIKKCFDLFINKYNPNKLSFIVEGDKKANIYLSFFNTKLYDITKKKSNLKSLSEYIPYLYMIRKKD